MYRLKWAIVSMVAMAWLGTIACGSSHNDQSLKTDIEAKLYNDPITKGSNIGVAVQNGAVTLSGDVSDASIALEAMKIANSTAGIKSVNDKMTINGAEAANQANQVPHNGAPPPPPSSQPVPPVANGKPSSPELNTTSQTAPPALPAESAAPAPSSGSAAPAPPPEPAEITIPAGERIQVRTIDPIDSRHASPGETFRATLSAPLVSGRRVVIPAGAPATILLAEEESAGRIKGRNQLALRLVAVQYHGKSYQVDTNLYEAVAGSKGKQTAERTGIGAAAGAIIGALAGGGKGAAIGSAVGGGAGLGVNIFTHGPQVKIPSETILTFRLKAPLTVEQ
jgi:hypothetical protein